MGEGGSRKEESLKLAVVAETLECSMRVKWLLESSSWLCLLCFSI